MKRVNAKGVATKTTAWILSAAMTFSACPMTIQAEEMATDVSSNEVVETEVATVINDVDETAQENTETKEVEQSEATEETEQSVTSEVIENATQTVESEVVEETEQTASSNVSVEMETIPTTEDATVICEMTTESALEEELAVDAGISLFAENGNVSKTCPTIGSDGDVTFHYYPATGEEVTSAYVKGSWDSSWNTYFYMEENENGVWSVTTQLSLDKSYEYGIMVNENWVGDPTNPRSGGNSEILRNPRYNSDGSVSIFYYPQGEENVSLLYKTTDDADYTEVEMTTDAYHSALLSATVSEQGDYTYMLEVDGEQVNDLNCKEAAFTISKIPEDDKSVLSPVVKDGKVTFHYYAPTVSTVSLAGEMNGWDSSATPMSYNEETGFWSVEQELAPGKYEYKFVVDGGNWVMDSRNDKQSNGNSVCYVSGLQSASLDIEAGSEVALPATLKLFDENGNAQDVTPEYTVEEQYREDVTITEGKLFVPNGFEAEVVKIIAASGDYESVITVNVKKVVYTYTIYYMNETRQTTDSASLWIWENNGAGGVQYFFTESEKLSDGNTWLKAEVALPYTDVMIIPRAYADWSWQDVTVSFNNEASAKEVTLYLVATDNKAYTELPEVIEKESRYILIEYNRLEKDYEGWNIYSWNTGYGSEVTVDFEAVGNKMVAYVPVVDTKDSISFCMRRSEAGNAWAEKDGGDHTIAIPLDQTIVKAQFTQGEGVVGNLPYNKGYETNVTDGEITFYYRDDALYQKYEEASLKGEIKLVWDGETYEMNYDEANERYFYTGKLEAGEHYYGYQVKDSIIADKYNDITTEVEGVTYSTYEYVAFEAELKTQVSPATIDYNDNAVLKLSLENEEIEKKIQVVEAYADLSELGMSSKFVVDPELMAGTIAVKESITAGEKKIPVTVKDQYGNLYTATATVTVKERTAGKDFDWDEAVIYFTVTDRFFDGNSSNNDAYGTGTYDTTMGSMYHGGDFAGLEAKLDYLQELGVNTVWITPVVENIETVLGCDGHEGQTSAGYHGYWASDFTKINQHLGTEEEFAALIDAMHARGMKLMVDVVLNHAGYGTEESFDSTYIDGKNMLRDSETTIAGDEKKDGLSGLPDFVTEDAEVRQMLIAWQTEWVSKYDIDYFRVDTVKHVEDTTWKAFKNALTEVNPDFKMIGEHAGSGYATNAGQLGTGQMDSLLDFDFNDKALAFVNGDIRNVESFMEARNAGINNTATVGSFLGSHDEDGLMYRMTKEYGNFSMEKAYDMMKVAATLQLTAKGQPVIYYGEELGQTGANNWPYQENRYDMNWSIANAENEMLTHYEKLLEIRNAYTDVFAKGSRTTTMMDEANGVLVVNRAYGNDTLYVGFNVNHTEEKQAEVTLLANTTYTDLYSGKTYTTDADGNVMVTIPSAENGGTVVLKAGKVVTPEQPSKPEKPKKEENKQESTNQNTAESKKETTVITEEKVALTMVPKFIEKADTYQVPLLGTNGKISVKEMLQLNRRAKTMEAYLSNTMAITMNMEQLTENVEDMDLGVYQTRELNYGQGFESVTVVPTTETALGVNVSVHICVGAEHAGKTAYLFAKNLQTGELECVQTSIINEIGNVAYTTDEYRTLVVLYK